MLLTRTKGKYKMESTVGAGVLFRLMETAALNSEQQAMLNQFASVFKSIGVSFIDQDTLVLDNQTVRMQFRSVPNQNLYSKFVQAMEDSGVAMPKTPDFNVALGTDGHRYWQFNFLGSASLNQRADLPKTITVDELQCVVYIKF